MVEHLPRTHEALSRTLVPHNFGEMEHTSHLSTGWYRQKGQKSKVIFTHREFEINLGCVRHCLKENKHIKTEQQPIELKEGTEKNY